MTETLRNMTTVFLARDGKILLLFRQGGRVVNNLWVGSAGGHFEPDELNRPEACVLRELREELGVSPDEIEGLCLRYITLRRVGSEIRQNYYYFAALSDRVNRPLASNEGQSAWFAPTDILALDMPVTAKFVMEHYLAAGYRDDCLYCGVADGETMVFTPLARF